MLESDMKLITFPGLIDPHVHLRTPGQEYKEDFLTGTKAALAGGFTTIIDMPNNAVPITTLERLEAKREIAKTQIVCDTGFYFGSLGDNLDEFDKVKRLVHGLKLYMNPTTGNYLLSKDSLPKIFAAWPEELPILFHAEGTTFDDVLDVVKAHPRKIHLCHMSTAYELKQVIKAKEQGLPVTCGVTAHHLFLSEADVARLKAFGMMKPPLSTPEDVAFLWKHLDAIDLIESDHAPHTFSEKETAAEGHVPHGVPGLETTLPLLTTAMYEGKITREEIVRLCHDGPSQLLQIADDEGTKVEVDMDDTYVLTNDGLFTKAGWTPFAGRKMHGRVKRVFIRGEKVFENGKLLALPGFGKLL